MKIYNSFIISWRSAFRTGQALEKTDDTGVYTLV